jgi:putative heme-binding domain-containing protein
MVRHITSLGALLIFAALALQGSPESAGQRGVEAAIAPWVDRALKITDRLAFWFDASRLSAARKAYGRPALLANEPVDVCYDGSGRDRHLAQGFPSSRPLFVTSGELAAVRFDGIDDCLSNLGPAKSTEEFTALILAAPRTNPGSFRALLSCNETGKNDYVTGFNIDLGPTPSSRLASLNVEGRGFGGAVNLLKESGAFGEFHVFAVRGKVGKNGVQLFVDGRLSGQRDRGPGVIRLDQINVGARFYSNSAAAPSWRDFFHGDLAQLLLYERALTDDELAAAHSYMQSKAAALNQSPLREIPDGAVPLVAVANPPAVQMLVPGFSARELPVDLTNINNLRYRADGKLVALAYDGKVYVLSSSTPGGLEDRVEVFWDNPGGTIRGPIGMALTPPGYEHGEGVFIACKGMLVLVADTKGTGKADKLSVIAKGWKEINHGVDALGVALDRDGSIYFGLGTADYTNGYLVDKTGKAHYDLSSERGTILKVAPDFKKREIVCTGIRFPVGLAFNRLGDLFATDQEGATWLPNGNPLDELLHIQAGRHYGFPPRHPKHLTGVVDEPSVFDYGPQHQSTCGLCFNDPVNGGPIFGPAGWDRDALIAGYSRGKLYRTKLAKSPVGYVAQNHLLAALNKLAVDACLSPRGELVVAVHGGLPDWGTGPSGKGKLYRITHAEPSLAAPVLAWSAGPREVRIAFDRPLDPAHLVGLIKQIRIEYGKYVRPGDRFESLRPGYAAVQMQLAAPRYALQVHAAHVSPDRRTLILATGEHREAVSYAITLPGLGRRGAKAANNDELPQIPEVDLGYDLGGVGATWQPANGQAGWSGWLPHLDLDVARAFTAGSADHDTLWAGLNGPGTLALHCHLNLWQMLRPAVQPGSSLDYAPAPEQVTLVLEAPEPFRAKVDGTTMSEAKKTGVGWRIEVQSIPKELQPIDLSVEMTTSKAPALKIATYTKEDARLRAIALHRFLLPWASTAASRPIALESTERPMAELKGGDWARGRQVFFSDEAACSRCHQVSGQGGKIGPDLGNLIHRDYQSVLRDIREPSAAINPDYITHLVELKSGKVLVGVLRSSADKLIVGQQNGQEALIDQADVESITPQRTSTMPDGLDKVLGPAKMLDLLTFLLTQPLRPAALARDNPPPARAQAEVDAVLRGSIAPTEKGKPLKILLAAGPKDHGPSEHDYPLWQRRWNKLLMLADSVSVMESFTWPTAAQFAWADLIVMYSNNPGWNGGKAGDLDAYLNRGGALVLIHWAVDGHDAGDALAKRIGLAWNPKGSKFRHGPLEVDFTASKHPIVRGYGKVSFLDESYWNLHGDPDGVEVLGTCVEENKSWPLFWTKTQGQGRVFVSIPGHYTWTFDDPLYRLLILRALAWTTGEPIDRFNSLTTVGARMAEPGR